MAIYYAGGCGLGGPKIRGRGQRFTAPGCLGGGVGPTPIDGGGAIPEPPLLGALVAVGAGSKISSSADGLIWTARASNALIPIRRVTYSRTLATWCWAGVGAFLGRSFDGGITWPDGEFEPGISTRDIAWSPRIPLWVAVGDDSQNPNILTTSPDFITWTPRTPAVPSTSNFRCIEWIDDLRLFVAGTDVGELVTSPDGKNWTARNSGFGATAINGIAWSSSLSRLIIVGDAGKLATSPDAITFTQRVSGFGANSIQSIAWATTLNLYCIVGQAGLASTSPTGEIWTARVTGLNPLTDNLLDICWSTQLGMLVAVGGGDAGIIVTSLFGIDWTPRISNFGLDSIFGVSGTNP